MSRKRRARQRRQAIVNLALIVALVAGAGTTFYLVQRDAGQPYDAITLCPIGVPLPGHTAVILDKTDNYTAEQSRLIENVIARTRNRLEVGERFSIFELDAVGEFDPRGELSLCNPGRGNQVNPLFRNPQQIEERYRALFDEPLQAILGDLVEPKTAPKSPVLEALARLAQTEAFGAGVDNRRVVLVSDMLQNSDLFTAYGGGGALPDSVPPADALSEAVVRRFGTALDGVALEIRLIPRPGFGDLQRGALKDYWNAVFADLGVTATWRDL